MLEEEQHKTQEALRPLMREDRHHKHLEGFLIQILELTILKEGLPRTIILIEESIHNLQIDEVIVLLEIIPLIAQVELVVIGLHLKVQVELVVIGLHQEVMPHQDQHQPHQEAHLLQEAVQEVLEKNKKNYHEKISIFNRRIIILCSN